MNMSAAPLAGRRIVNTRALRDAAALDALLIAHGAVPLSYPCIAIAPPADLAPLDQALTGLAAGAYPWLVLTSANAVEALAGRITALRLELPVDQRVAVVGPGTAGAFRDLIGRGASFVPSGYSAEHLGAELPITPGERIIVPGSARSRPTLATALRARGAEVDVVASYTTVRGEGGIHLLSELERGTVDAVLFTSSSTVRFCLERLASEGGTVADLAPVAIGCIGTETAATARELGLTVGVVPAEQTLPGLVTALDEHVRQGAAS